VNYVKDEFGEVAGQLLEYTYARVPGEQRTKGESLAIDSSYAWSQSLIVSEFQPATQVVELIHQGDSATCDAVWLSYRSEIRFATLEIEISQSIFLIDISIAPKVWPAEWDGVEQDVVNRFARRFFRDSGRLNLKLDKRRNGVSLGSQVPSPTVNRADRDWRDSLRWWLDRETLGFVVLKRTGSGQAVLPALDLQSNQVWFQMLERSRTG